jgi:hypothetical protein
MAKKKAKAKATEKTEERSAIIKQCTIYAQLSAAYEGGFYADPTGDFDYAGSGPGQIGSAYCDNKKRALEKLVALSREKRPITADELFAEARVINLLMKTDARSNPEPVESDFVRRFTKDVELFLNPLLACPR